MTEPIETTPEPEPLPIQILLAKVMADLKVLPKGEKFAGRGMDSYSFRGVDSTINAVGPLFRRYGIVGPVPNLRKVTYETVPIGKDGHLTGFARVEVTYEFFGPTGDKLSCAVPGEAMDRGDKALAKAMSVALRIALLQLLCLPTQSEDPDDVNYDRAPVGSGMARNEPEPLTPADEAREELLALVKQNGWNARLIAKRYQDEIGTSIQEESEAQRIKDFAERIYAEA